MFSFFLSFLFSRAHTLTYTNKRKKWQTKHQQLQHQKVKHHKYQKKEVYKPQKTSSHAGWLCINIGSGKNNFVSYTMSNWLIFLSYFTDQNSYNTVTCMITDKITMMMYSSTWIRDKKVSLLSFQGLNTGLNVSSGLRRNEPSNIFFLFFLLINLFNQKIAWFFFRGEIDALFQSSSYDRTAARKREERRLATTLTNQLNSHNYHSRAYISQKYTSKIL